MGRPRDKSKRQNVTLTGDIGPQTSAQMAGARLDPIGGPNGRMQKRRENVLERMHRNRTISLRQYQAGIAIQEAHCNCERLSSGNSDYSKPIVDSTPVPDRFTDRQVDAHSRLNLVMSAIPNISRRAIEQVCWYNNPIPRHGIQRSTLKVALNIVADVLRY